MSTYGIKTSSTTITTTEVTLLTIDISSFPVGSTVKISSNVAALAHAITALYARVSVGTTSILRQGLSSTVSTGQAMSLSPMTIFTKQSGDDTVTLKVNRDSTSGTVTLNYAFLSAEVIGFV